MLRDGWDSLFSDYRSHFIIRRSPSGDIAIYGAIPEINDDDTPEFIDPELMKEIERTNARWHEGR